MCNEKNIKILTEFSQQIYKNGLTAKHRATKPGKQLIQNHFLVNLVIAHASQAMQECVIINFTWNITKQWERMYFFGLIKFESLNFLYSKLRACNRCAQGNITDCFNLHCLPMDGIERGVMSINRLIPGPYIHVCKDDLIVVDVVNMMGGTATTLHWHGLHMRDTPFMDGVPFITQVSQK